MSFTPWHSKGDTFVAKDKCIPQGWMMMQALLYREKSYLWCGVFGKEPATLCIRKEGHEGEHWFVRRDDAIEFFLGSHMKRTQKC